MNGRRIFLFGFIAILLIGIPVTIYLVQKQQETRSHAEKSTNVTFIPDSSATAPIQKNVGDPVPLDITVDPGKNLVSFVKIEIQYDPQKLATASANAFVQNNLIFPSVLEGPVFTPGKISVTLSVGPDPTKSIQTKVKAATVTFKAISNTPPGTPTLVSYGATTQILSIGSNDQASENVLSSATPAYIAIGGTVVTPSVDIPTSTPVPTIPVTPIITPVVSPSPSSTPSANANPVCSNLALDRSATGNTPLALAFTANGTDSDGTISKVTFNFGDGQVADVTASGGVGTASVSAQASHNYQNAGTFTAFALLTDNSGGVSDSASCQQIVTVTGGGSTVTNPPAANPTPTLAPTGSSSAAIGIGAVIVTFIVGGGFLFFLL
ncbi:MAG TPA: PKD domain-containing protein [Candidatus Saccharimonadales bacterium]|nr:PKD domain-containing protein [Candidatus Saccharimonadales bacterium]